MNWGSGGVANLDLFGPLFLRFEISAPPRSHQQLSPSLELLLLQLPLHQAESRSTRPVSLDSPRVSAILAGVSLHYEASELS